MKNTFKIYSALLLMMAFVFGCNEEREFQQLMVEAPSNIGADFNIISDNSGTVTMIPKGNAVTEFRINFGDGSADATASPGQMISHVYDEGDFTVTIQGVGADGQTASATQELVIRFDPPSNLQVDIAIDSRQVVVTPSADGATLFDITFGEVDGETPGVIMPGEDSTYVYSAIGEYDINIVARGAGAATTDTTITVNIFDKVLMPLRFESETVGYAFNGFGGGSAQVIDNPDPAEPNTTQKVVQFTKAEGSETWAGVTIDISEPLNFTDFNKVKMTVWSPKAGATILFKAEQIGDPNVFAEVSMVTTVANQWEELLFDFSEADPSLDLRRLAFFFDFGVAGDGASYYFDNCELTNEGAAPLALPIDFENPNIPYSFENFGGANSTVVANPDMNGNPSSMVAQLNKIAGSEVWAGSFLELPTPIDFSQSQSVSVRTWSPKAGATVRLKLENATDGGIFVETDAVTSVANQWEVLTFDFSSGFDLTQELHKVVIFFDFGNNGDDSNYYFDDITLGAPAGPKLTLPVDFESSELNYAFSDFGNAFAEVVDNPDMSGINMSSKVGKLFKQAGSEVWAGSFLTLEENMDFMNNDVVKVKVWSPKSGITVRVKVEHPTDGAIFHEVDATTTTNNAWEELTYDFSGASTTDTYTKFVVFFDFGNNGDDSDYYFDDLRLEPAGGSGGGGGGGGTGQLYFPVDFESAELSYTFSDFGNAFSEVIDNPDMSGINTSAKVGKLFKQEGSEVWAGSFLTLDQNMDFANNNTIKVKVWSPKSGITVRVKVEHPTDGAIFHEVDATTTTNNAWEELTYDFSGASTTDTYTKLVIFFDFGTNGDGSDYYFDDFRLE